MCIPTQVSTRAGSGKGVELADLFRKFEKELTNLPFEQAKVVKDITQCRTPALGGRVEQCDHCGNLEVLFNSCRNRHCPKCQNLPQAHWLEARLEDLLPVEYFHVVFTIPDVLHSLVLANRGQCYNLLFQAVSETLQEVAQNPDNLGARIGFMTVLHTWTQKVLFHPHIHCIVPGGGLNESTTQWVSSKSRFLFPVKILSAVFRGKFLKRLEQSLQKLEIRLANEDPLDLLRKAAKKPWVVYSKPPFAGPEQVLKYLSRYTHRIAISNSRLIRLDGRELTLKWKDRSKNNKSRLLVINVVQFLHRFLLHVLPKGFMRIRYYGIFANSVRKENIKTARILIGIKEGLASLNTEKEDTSKCWQDLMLELTGIDVTLCPLCKKGHMVPLGPIEKDPDNPSFLPPGRGTSP